MIKIFNIIFLFMISGLFTSPDNQINYLYEFSNINTDNIEFVEDEYLSHINISNLNQNEFYLLNLESKDGTEIDYQSNIDNYYDSSVSLFVQYTKDTYFGDDYSNYKIFKCNSKTINISFEKESDYNFSIYKKDLYKSNRQMNETSLALNDLKLMNIYTTNHRRERNNLIALMNSSYYNQDTIFFYIYSNEDTKLDSLTLEKPDKSTIDITIGYLSTENDIHKYYVNIFSMNELSDCEIFKIVNYNVESNYNRTNTTFDEQVIELTFETNLIFSIIEKVEKKIIGESHYYDQEINSFNPFKNDGDFTRYHYILFDIYFNNVKVNLLEELGVKLTAIELIYSTTPIVEKLFESDMYLTDSELTKYQQYYLNEYNLANESSYNNKSDYIEKITPTIQQYDNSSTLDKFLSLFGIESKPYYFNTLSYKSDVKDEQFEKVSFGEYDYCAFYNSYNDGDDVVYGSPVYKNTFNYVGTSIKPVQPVFITSMIVTKRGINTTAPKAIKIELTYKGESKTFDVDSNLTPPTEEPEPPFKADESLWEKFLRIFKDFFGFDFTIIIVIAIIIVMIVVLGVLIVYAPFVLRASLLIAKYVLYFVKKILTSPFRLLRKIGNKK